MEAHLPISQVRFLRLFANEIAFFYELDRNVETVEDFYSKKSADLLRRLKLLIDKYGDSQSDQLDYPELDDLVIATVETLIQVGALMDLRIQMQKLSVDIICVRADHSGMPRSTIAASSRY
jgi:hypothetical protein